MSGYRRFVDHGEIDGAGVSLSYVGGTQREEKYGSGTKFVGHRWEFVDCCLHLAKLVDFGIGMK